MTLCVNQLALVHVHKIIFIRSFIFVPALPLGGSRGQQP